MDEGDQITITLTVDGLTSGIFYASDTDFAGGTAITGTDFRDALRGNTHLHGNTLGPYRVGDLSNFQRFNILADSQPEPDETIVLPVPRVNTAHPFHSTTDTFAYGEPLTITIRASDGYTPTPSFSIAVDDADTAEGDTAVFTVT